jgi:CDP-diacylglycerol--serine O-phosphatidyltransferase
MPVSSRRPVRMSATDHPRHFSLIRGLTLADLFTLGNGLCGVAAIFAAVRFAAANDPRHIYAAAVLIVVALVLDVLDGWVARRRGQASALGRELDSLADVISFGVAPAAIAFAIGLDFLLDEVILIYFALCGLSRLARYNVTAEALSGGTGKVAYFEGTPIPTSIVPLGLLVLAFHRGELYPVSVFGVDFHLPVVLFLVSGSLMISRTLRIPKP